MTYEYLDKVVEEKGKFIILVFFLLQADIEQGSAHNISSLSRYVVKKANAVLRQKQKGIGFTDELSYPNHRRLWVGGFIMPLYGTELRLTKRKYFNR